MEYRFLGKTGLQVSALSLGSWVTFHLQVDVDAATDCMNAAYAAGVNFFDNAEVYSGGKSEEVMGAALKKLGWRRSSYLVSTKIYFGINEGVNEQNTLNRKRLIEAINMVQGDFAKILVITHMEELKDAIYDRLGFIRIFLKPQSGPADLDEPLIMRTGSKIEDVCRKLHRDFVDKFRYARIWGTSVKHEAQRVGIAHSLADEDILQIIIER